MLTQSVLYPLLTMVGLTFLIMPCMLVVRIRAVTNKQLSARYFKNFSTEENVPPLVVQFQRHFSNLFEVPVLFYAACILVYCSQLETPMITILAWSFVFLRALHTLVHLTYNKVYHRMIPFILSTVVLAFMWLAIGKQAHFRLHSGQNDFHWEGSGDVSVHGGGHRETPKQE